MVREDIYKKNGINTSDHNRFVKLLEGFDARLDALDSRAENIEKQLEPMYKAVILNSPQMRDEVVKRVFEHLGYRGTPPTAAQQPMNAHEVTQTPEVGAAPRESAKPVLEFECRMCTELTDDAKRVKVGGHHDILVCPRCAGKLSDIISALLS